jgi:FtsH-binding integral membrane protein
MIDLNKTRTSTSNYSYDEVIHVEDAAASRKFIANVFLWMFVALAVSAGAAYAFAFNQNLLSLLFNLETGGRTGLGTLLIFAPFVFIMVMSFGMNKLSYPVLTILFVAFAAVMGMSLSSIFLVYNPTAIFSVFVTTSVVFGVMAVAGYTTSQDLTKFGSILIMLLFGIIIASFVNMFMHNEGLGQVITYIGVAVFVGLTAYDVQKLKRIGASDEFEGATKSKLGLMGALTLYLDFVNLFLMLLRLFGGGNRR